VLAGDSLIDRRNVVAIDTLRAASGVREGQWHYIPESPAQPRFRIMAVMSTHAPNIGNFTVSDYTLPYDLVGLPPTPYQWPKGEVYAYVIDVLGADGAVLFRIYYQDSASDPEHSVRPMLPNADTRAFDLAIVCGGNFDNTESYPTMLLGKLTPSYALVGHWESFFRHVDKEPRLIPGLNGGKLQERMNTSMGARWAAMMPFSSVIFALKTVN
jgi:hypothetical protein